MSSLSEIVILQQCFISYEKLTTVSLFAQRRNGKTLFENIKCNHILLNSV